ncbi:hypothetical protein Q7P37_001196 [Cladosporium fusiforme]
MARSSTSSFADDYYNYASDALSDDSYHRKQDSFPLPPTTAAQPSQPQHSVKKHTSLAQISVPSFSAFRSQTSGIPITATRNRGSLLPSPRPTSFSAAEKASPRIAEPASRPLSLDSPLPRHPSGLAYILTPPLTTETAGKQERLSYAQPPRAHDRSESIDSRLARTESVSSRRTSRRSSIPIHEKYAHEQTAPLAPQISHTSTDTHSQYSLSDLNGPDDAPMIDDKPAVSLQLGGVQRTLSDASLLSDKRPKSPSRLGALFGWKSSPTKSGTESPTTTFSDRSSSPVPSPRYQKPLPMEPGSGARLTPSGLDIARAQASYFDQPTTPIYLNSSESNAHVQELERELSQVSEELAGSIRREMELEDELERLRLEAPTIPSSDAGRRSSDYFSDSGASSTKFPISDPDARIEEVDRLRRKAEQDKAQVMADNAQRLQTEMTKRRELEQLVQSLEEQMQDKSRNEDERLVLSEKVTELETSLDETKRRLVDEKKAKDNFEDLYSATREELEQRRNERDNLRDEILPRMKERLDGLEAQASDNQALLYENTRMAQELNALKHEQSLFFESQRMSQAGGHGSSMFDMIAEEKDIVSPIIGGPPRAGLSRSSSLAGRSTSKTRGSMNRSDSVKGREGGRQRSGSSGPLSLEAQKEIEDQRDALHKALKLLISRYEKQSKAHERAMKKLNKEKKAADLRAADVTPKRSQYTREVTFLKEEVNMLRKRTEDALEQKWEYEKGLSGIKMDLDRAEQETRGLRHLLQEQDIVLTSPQAPADPAQDQLSFSISTAKSERDYARRMAEAFRQRALNLQEISSADSTDEHQPPAVAKLFDSANSMDELAEQLDGQVRANSDLRCRLTEAVEKGEREQRESTRQVEEMQKRLAVLEDSVLAAATHSETTLSTHEGEVRRMEEASSPSLKRLEISIPDPTKLMPGSPAMKLAQSPRLPSSAKRLADISSAASLQEASKTQNLEREVREMEFTLREAAAEMQRVLQRVNRSQDEVAELTSERDRAVGELRRLKSMVAEEERKADAVA